jgi:hypothetical protein
MLGLSNMILPLGAWNFGGKGVVSSVSSEYDSAGKAAVIDWFYNKPENSIIILERTPALWVKSTAIPDWIFCTTTYRPTIYSGVFESRDSMQIKPGIGNPKGIRTTFKLCKWQRHEYVVRPDIPCNIPQDAIKKSFGYYFCMLKPYCIFRIFYFMGLIPNRVKS